MNATFFNNNSRAAQSGNTAVKKGTIPFLKIEQACFFARYLLFCFNAFGHKIANFFPAF
jgi:hypothetical protein